MRVIELINKLKNANPDAEIQLSVVDDSQAINDFFNCEYVDTSFNHPFTVYICNTIEEIYETIKK